MLKKTWIWVFVLFFFVNCEEKKGKNINNSPSDLFLENQSLELVLKMDMEKVLGDIGENRQWHEAVLVWNKKNIKIKVRTRGKFRRDADICNFAPLSIQLDSLDKLQTPFEQQNKLKLVTHCQAKNALYEQLIVEEYGIYKTYQLFTEKSLAVSLAKIAYQDTKNPQNNETKWGFFIENPKKASKRVQAKLLKNKDTIAYLECNSFLITQMAVFQFMIGNTDWSVRNKHNIEIIKTKNEYVAIPYDFDLAGLIAAPYAQADTEVGVNRVGERLYRGYCQSEAELELVLKKFEDKKHKIDSIWRFLPYHQAARNQKNRRYIADFYKIIENKDSIRKYFLEDCR